MTENFEHGIGVDDGKSQTENDVLRHVTYLDEIVDDKRIHDPRSDFQIPTVTFDNINNVVYPQGSKCRRRGPQWSAEEDEKLRKGVETHGTNNWGAVANAVGNNRTRQQCSQRWNRVIDPRISKASWTPAEEKRLEEIVEKCGVKSWKRVSNEMKDRSDVQCRFKYLDMMKKRKDRAEISQCQPDVTMHIDKDESRSNGPLEV